MGEVFASQLEISIRDLDLLTIGMVNDMYVESGNDQDADNNYSVLATQADFDRFQNGGFILRFIHFE